MTAGTAIKQGLGTARRVRSAVWDLFLVNLALAALAGIPCSLELCWAVSENRTLGPR